MRTPITTSWENVRQTAGHKLWSSTVQPWLPTFQPWIYTGAEIDTQFTKRATITTNWE